jgi:8-oxo-dGTP pyrophosphatase MutT (NUDIX family)
MKDEIHKLVQSIKPYDKEEKKHVQDVLIWITSGAGLFRIKKPDVPPQHLVSYFVLIDNKQGKILLVDHRKAKLLLPPGGHVEKNENPKKTVEREIREELGIEADFISGFPFFITVTKTVNIDAGHTDVSLWYLLKGDSTKSLIYDKGEFSGYHWLSFDEVLNLSNKVTDPHMHRLVKKLLAYKYVRT